MQPHTRIHDGGGGSNLYGRTQRELLAYVASPALNTLDEAHDMWKDVSTRAGQIRELIIQRLDRLTAEGGWTGAGAEAYRTMITDDLVRHLTALEDTADDYAKKLSPVTGAISTSWRTAEQNNIPWDVQTQWKTRRQHVDQSIFGKFDEFFTGEDEAYEEAKANAPTEVVDGNEAIVKTVPKPEWDSALAANPDLPPPLIFQAVSSPVTRLTHQFDRLLEWVHLNDTPHSNVQGAALSVETAMSDYQPDDFPTFEYRGGAYSEKQTDTPAPPAPTPPGGGGGSGGGGGGSTTPPGGGGGGDTTPPGGGGGGGGSTTPPGGGGGGGGGPVPMPPPGGPIDDPPGGWVGPPPEGPIVEVPIVDDPPRGPIIEAPEVPIVEPPGGIGDPPGGPIEPPGGPIGERDPGTSPAGLGGIGGPVGSPAPTGAVMTGSPAPQPGGIGAMGSPMAAGMMGGGAMAGSPGTSFQVNGAGRATVNPGSTGNIAGSGSGGDGAGRGGGSGMGGGAPMAGRRQNQRKDEEEEVDETEGVWLEEEESVWGDGQSAPPPVIR
ncbi:WXG100 family type VII secretion target [Enemella sp. A6]|uniref:WXG100 family type VII secretion target n=1 Tax=Enemella sp. A6 TaxID=3440152 RepID=UPI003EBD2CB1